MAYSHYASHSFVPHLVLTCASYCFPRLYPVVHDWSHVLSLLLDSTWKGPKVHERDQCMSMRPMLGFDSRERSLSCFVLLCVQYHDVQWLASQTAKSWWCTSDPLLHFLTLHGAGRVADVIHQWVCAAQLLHLQEPKYLNCIIVCTICQKKPLKSIGNQKKRVWPMSKVSSILYAGW